MHSWRARMLMAALLALTTHAYAQEQVQDPAPAPVAANGPAVRAVGIQVMSTDLDQEAFGGMSPMSASPGTTVAVLVTTAGKAIVSVDTDACEVTAINDSQGNSMLEEAQEESGFGMAFMMQTNISPFPEISEDGTMTIVELQAPKTPAPGSDSVHIEAKLAINVAAGTKTETAEHANLQAGALNIPGHNIKISQTGEAQWGNGEMSVTFSMSTDSADAIADIRFIDDAGNDITDQRYSTMTMMNTAEIEYGIKKKVDRATIQFIFHDQMEKLEVPVNLDVSLGL